jgi:pimeloyl-ACP methyl ester carboxylesterase
MTTRQRHRLKLAEIELSYLEWNPGGEPILLLHGLGDCAVVWSQLAETLGSSYHVVAPDLRGHGESSKPDRGYTAAETIADLEGLLDRLGWESAHILGHSWSGKLAAIWARQAPHRFKSAILVDPIFITKLPGFLKLSFPILYRTLACLKLGGPFETYEQARQQARQLPQFGAWSPLQERVFEAEIEEKADGRWGSKFAIAARDGIFDDVMRTSGLTETIAVPTLFVQPQAGVNRREWQMKPYRKYLQNLQIVRVPGNHWPFLVESDVFNQTIADFLKNFSEASPAIA